MRLKALLLLFSVLTLVIGSAVPAGAARSEKTEYMTAGCAVSYGWADRWWETGDGDIHYRGMPTVTDIYLLTNDTWVLIGELTGIDNANVDADFNGMHWGTWSLRDDGSIGDFDGRYRYPENGPDTGTGKDSDGRLTKMIHGVEAPIPLPKPWTCAAVKVLVIDPHA